MVDFTDEDARRAVEDVRRGESLRKASSTWGIPRTTLAKRLEGARPRHEAVVDNQRLTPSQEQAVAGWAWVEAQLGRPPMRVRIKEVAQQILATTGDHKPLGKNWIDGFLMRNPAIKEIKYKRPNKRAALRAARAAAKEQEHVHEPMFVLKDAEDGKSPDITDVKG